MTENNSSDNKNKPTIFYAKNTSKEEKPYSSRYKRDGDKSSQSKKRSYDKSSDKPRSARFNDNQQNSNRFNDNRSESRIETFKPRNQRNFVKDESSDNGSSPWKSRSQNHSRSETNYRVQNDKEAISNESDEFHERLKQQRKNETIVYSENSCKAIFRHRPNDIIKAFVVKEKTYEFKSLISHLVDNRLGYDVIDNEKMTRIAQTPHHGGICLIVKKRTSQLPSDYLFNAKRSDKDCILAIDDINNPHNLGGIARTAAFFGVNGLMLRQPDILDNGAALRVSEGGTESLSLIKSDDLIASIDLFKQQGYQVVALLPCKVNSLPSDSLVKSTLKKKVAFIIFQQINTKLASFADNVVYLEGSEVMSALNISVLTGILLAKWQETSK